jgi:hypothetical protein
MINQLTYHTYGYNIGQFVASLQNKMKYQPVCSCQTHVRKFFKKEVVLLSFFLLFTSFSTWKIKI